MEPNENDEVDMKSMEYKLGFKRYRYVRDAVENILNKSYKRRIPLYVVMCVLLDCVDDEYQDADISTLIESIKELL